MGKPLSMDLRLRIFGFVNAGHSCRAAALKFEVSPSCVIGLMKRYDETGSLEPARQGRPTGGKLEPLHGFLVRTVETRPDITMPELADLVQREHGIVSDPSWFSRVLISLGFTYKKIADRDGAWARKGPARATCLDDPTPAQDAPRAVSAGVSG